MGRNYYTLLILFCAALFINGCRGSVAVKPPPPADEIEEPSKSNLPVCPGKYRRLRPAYDYPDNIKNCYSRALDADLYFKGGESVQIVEGFLPATEKNYFTMAYDESGHAKYLTYYDWVTGNDLRLIAFLPDGSVDYIYDYDGKIGKIDRAVFYYADGAPRQTEPYGGFPKTEFYPDGSVKKIFKHKGSLPDYSYEYEEGGSLKQFVKFHGDNPKLNRIKPSGPSSDNPINRAAFESLSNLPHLIINFDEAGLPAEAHEEYWDGLKLTEYIYYRADGKAVRYRCDDGGCLKYNKNKPWQCDEGPQPCSGKATGRGYPFRTLDFAGELRKHPVPVAGDCGTCKHVCDVFPQAFQCGD